jgi:hypothetical protein
MNTRQAGQSTVTTLPADLAWNSPGVASVRYKFFFDREVYELEQRRLFRGPVWNYVAIESEIPDPGRLQGKFRGRHSYRGGART